MTSPLTEDEFLARCEALAPELAARAQEGEDLRRMPEETIEALHRADLFRAAMPTSLGGHGLGLDAICQATRILAHGCPASAWTISFFIQHAWLLSKFHEEARAELYADGQVPLAAAPLAPTGQITAVDGGFTVDGRWEWATGVEHCNWVMAHALEVGPELTTRFVLVPRSEVVVDDVWFTSGMRATGSNTVRIEGVFVPEHRTLPARSLLDGVVPVAGDGLSGLPLVSVLALVAAAPAIGAAEAAVDLYRQRLSERVLAYTLGDRAAEQPAAQIRLAAAMSDLAQARAGWDAAIRTMVAACADGTPSDQVRVDTKLAAAATVRSSRRIIESVGAGSGASVYLSNHPFQRLQRDVETLKGHVVFDWDRAAELAGRVTLGFGLRPTDMA